MSPIGGSVVGFREIAYVGPGDVVAGAFAWWGSRAYSNATIGANAVRLRRSSDNAEDDFITLSDGSLDVASIATFKGAANLFVVKMYDQTGNARDYSQTTAANQPTFTLSVFGALPAVGMNAVGDQQSLATSSITVSQPFSVSFVSGVTNVGGGNDTLWWRGDFQLGIMALTSLQMRIMDAGGAGNLTQSGTFTSGEGLALQGVWNGGSSVIMVDGTDTTGGSITTGGITGAMTLGGAFNVGSSLAFGEMGIWSSAFSGADRSNLDSNERTYWGF